MVLCFLCCYISLHPCNVQLFFCFTFNYRSPSILTTLLSFTPPSFMHFRASACTCLLFLCLRAGIFITVNSQLSKTAFCFSHGKDMMWCSDLQQSLVFDVTSSMWCLCEWHSEWLWVFDSPFLGCRLSNSLVFNVFCWFFGLHLLSWSFSFCYLWRLSLIIYDNLAHYIISLVFTFCQVPVLGVFPD